MEIIRGSLDDISRPVSSEQTGSRVSSVSLPHSDRICPTAPFSLVVLPNDAAHIQLPSSSEDTTADSAARGPGKDQSHTDASEEDNEHFKLQRAIEEIKRLDEILSAKICKQKEIRRQRKELQAKLWQEFLQNRPEGHSESAQEALNTRLFLALEAQNETEEEDDFVPVFDTQIPEHEQNGNNQHLKPSKKRPDSLIKSFGGEYEDTGEDQFESSCSGDSKGMNKQKDFVKKNIEETMWAVSVLTGQGYTPEPSDLEHLIDIDSKIRLLLPVEEFHSVQSSYTNVTMSQGPGSEVCWKCDGDPQPGEKVLQDIKERRGQERRLQEIQRQLELLGQSQEMTSESPDLTEEQLLGLMDGCELKESWSQDLEMND
ncbi:fibrous sheath-interacting protein 1 isoform X4 [Archocentrus centrarchus]|uniref:fibrous sheath-interacting protein 1 isoform X4 n=1 Tax=Archocentrus centrarchus TaxID=63155 RepID=UPI0011EA490F|nr:fibrous sheath-interacting protein 1 isoform X4 [Archocentrus centrarchus]